jgi:hypothetical protein
MATQSYIFSRGNGNEGNSPRFIVKLKASDNPWAALEALVTNEYIARGRIRRHIAANIKSEGEKQFIIRATVYEGPNGEQDFGSAWLTASLEPIHSDLDYQESKYNTYDLRKVLDSSALRLYRKRAK